MVNNPLTISNPQGWKLNLRVWKPWFHFPVSSKLYYLVRTHMHRSHTCRRSSRNPVQQETLTSSSWLFLRERTGSRLVKIRRRTSCKETQPPQVPHSQPQAVRPWDLKIHSLSCQEPKVGHSCNTQKQKAKGQQNYPQHTKNINKGEVLMLRDN